MKPFILVMFFSLIFGCTHGDYSNDKVTVGQLKKHINEENVSSYLDEILSTAKSDDAAKLSKMFEDNPDTYSKLIDYIANIVNNGVDKYQINYIAGFVKDLGSVNIVKDHKLYTDKINERAEVTNLNGQIPWVLGDEIESIDSLKTPVSQHIMFKRTLEKISDEKVREELISGLVVYLSGPVATGKEKNLAFEVISKYELSKKEYKLLSKIYPDYASEKLLSYITYFYIDSIPKDRLLEDDISKTLQKKSEDFVVVDTNSPKENLVIVNIEKLKHDEQILPPVSETIVYSMHEVNMIGAAFFMPTGSSYMYELTTSESNLEYGYFLKVIKNNNVVVEELFRGKFSEKCKSCNNQRIVNAFGGTSKAQFIANEDMKSRCSGSTTSKPSIDLLRNKLNIFLVDKIISNLYRR